MIEETDVVELAGRHGWECAMCQTETGLLWDRWHRRDALAGLIEHLHGVHPDLVPVAQLAGELGVSADSVRVYVDQLVGIDGGDRTIAAEPPILNGSGRVVGSNAYLTADAADFLREMHAAGHWGPDEDEAE